MHLQGRASLNNECLSIAERYIIWSVYILFITYNLRESPCDAVRSVIISLKWRTISRIPLQICGAFQESERETKTSRRIKWQRRGQGTGLEGCMDGSSSVEEAEHEDDDHGVTAFSCSLHQRSAPLFFVSLRNLWALAFLCFLFPFEHSLMFDFLCMHGLCEYR